jgi:hypothetical protein
LTIKVESVDSIVDRIQTGVLRGQVDVAFGNV